MLKNRFRRRAYSDALFIILFERENSYQEY
jgi:hypothetical protein